MQSPGNFKHSVFLVVLLGALTCGVLLVAVSLRAAQSADAGKKAKARSLVWNPPALDTPVPGVSASSACELSSVLEQAGERTSAMLSTLQNFTAQESIAYQVSDRQNFVQDAGAAAYDYIVVFGHRGDEPIVDERRQPRHGTPSEFATQSRGLPEIVLLFLPNMQSDYEMKCVGAAAWEGNSAWLVEFRQRDDRPSRTFAFRTDGGSYPVPLRGRAWIDADSGEVLHLETALVHGFPAIKVFHWWLSISYAPVSFQSRDVLVWLPRSADAYYDFGQTHTIMYHTFSDFLLFSVDTEQKIAKPKAPNPPSPPSIQ